MIAIEKNLGEFPLGIMCRALEISLPAWHRWRRRRLAGPSAAEIRFSRLCVHATEIFVRGGKRIGSRRMSLELRARGFDAGRHLARALMRASGLKCEIRQTKKTRPAGADGRYVMKNEIKDREKPCQLNEVWRTDITLIDTLKGTRYLALVMDDFSRKIIGRAWSGRCDAALTVEALAMACRQRRDHAGAIVHSDRGAQYTCAAWHGALEKRRLTGSMSATGNCFDNAAMERVFGTLKDELFRDRTLKSPEEAEEMIGQWAALEYNRKRPHSSLNNISPCAFEEKHRREFARLKGKADLN